MKTKYSEIPEVKSLRWIGLNFPHIDDPKDDNDKICNAIHAYVTAGANKIEALAKEIDELKAKLSLKDECVL